MIKEEYVMEKAAESLIVYCTDIADSHELKVMDFMESMDEIEITTPVYNDALKRGWIGDISFHTHNTIDIVTGDKQQSIYDKHRDVLLASVRIWSADSESVVTWKYRFLKK